RAFAEVEMPLTDAIAAAEVHSGGKAMGVSFQIRNGRPSYRVMTYRGNVVWAGKVDAVSGLIIDHGKTIFASKLDREDGAKHSARPSALTTLAEATMTAEAHTG